MEQVNGWMDTEFLLARWQIEPVELADYISHHGLPAYDINVEVFDKYYESISIEPEKYRVSFVEGVKGYRIILTLVRSNKLSFNLSDLENFEQKHPEIQSLNDWRWTADNLKKPVDYDNWAQMDYWDMKEAVQLVCGQEPDHDILDFQFTDKDYFKKSKNPVHREMARIYALATRGYLMNAIEHENALGGVHRIYPASFIKWAMNKNIPVPDKLLNGVRMYHKDEFKKEIIPNLYRESERSKLEEDSDFPSLQETIGRLRRPKMDKIQALKTKLEILEKRRAFNASWLRILWRQWVKYTEEFPEFAGMPEEGRISDVWPYKDQYERTADKLHAIGLEMRKAEDQILALDTESTPESLTKEIPEKSDVIPCDSGTKWEDIKITLVDDQDNIVRIKTPKGERPHSCHSLGLIDNRFKEGKPSALWMLLKTLCKNQGILSRENQEYDRVLPVTASKLNKHLQKIFEIEDSIFDGHYKKKHSYRSKIMFSDSSQVIE
jgi:hypothetical protein